MASPKMHRVSLLALFAFSAALSLVFAQHSHDGGYGPVSEPNQNRETPVISG